MNEADLRQKVLVPLFRAMGYKDVFEYHGGAQELGKDIVMWNVEQIRGRINFAVVAKAGRISGAASGPGSAREVAFQVQQCFGKDYLDPVTSEHRKVHHCFVVTNGEMKKEAIEAMRASLATSTASDRVDFISGETLWGLVAQHFSHSAELEALKEIGKSFASISPNYELIAITGPKGVALHARAKHPDASRVEPLKFKVSLAFPETAEAENFKQQLKRHLETGSQFSIPSSYIKEVTIPEILKPFMDTSVLNEIHVGPRTLPHPVPFVLIFRREGAPDLRLEDVELRATQVGTHAVTLDNHHQPLPWKFRFRLDKTKAQQFALDYEANVSGMNAKAQLQAARIQECFSAGTFLILEEKTTGIETIGARMTPGTVEPPPDGYVELLERVVLIQTRLRVPLTLPDGVIPADEVEAVHHLSDAIRKGALECTASQVDLVVARDGVEEVLAAPINELAMAEDRTWEILGQKMPVGLVVTSVFGLKPKDAAAFSANVAANPQQEEFEIALVPADGEAAKVVVKYAIFLPTEEAAALREQYRPGSG